jgi:hypothetical protein
MQHTKSQRFFAAKIRWGGCFTFTEDVSCGFALGASWLCHVAAVMGRIENHEPHFLQKLLGETYT